MTLLSRYLLRTIAGPFLLTLAVVLVALLLERLLRIVDLVTTQGAPVSTIFELILYLIPHYLGLAVPAALFLGVLVGIRQLWTGSEIAALWASGIGLNRLLPVLLGLAVALAAFDFVNVGYLQPHARYAYHALVHRLSQESVGFGLEEGVFRQKGGDIVLRAEHIEDGGRRLRRVFGRQASDGRVLTMSARTADVFRAADTGDLVVRMQDGTLVQDRPGRAPAALSFTSYDWVVPIGEPQPYGPRGQGERELTLPELAAARGSPPAEATASEVSAELHVRLIHPLSLIVLAVLAVPMGLLGSGRTGRAYGFIVGLFLVVLYEKVLSFGESFVAVGSMSPWLALWLPLAVFALLSGGLLLRAARGGTGGLRGRLRRVAPRPRPPLGALPRQR